MNNKKFLKNLFLSLQHVFTMFGATVLVPILTGQDISVALFTAGVGTIVFNKITKNKVPVFLGSSFAYIGSINLVKELYGIEYALGGIFIVGLIYIGMSFIVSIVGSEKIMKLLPPHVTYPLIIVIGISLAPTAINMASTNWYIAILGILLMIGFSYYAKGFFKIIPILSSIIIGYLICLLTGNVVIDLSNISVFQIPNFIFPKFNIEAIMIIAPISIVTLLEHIGDIESVSLVIGEDIKKTVGLHKTILGDGVASLLASCVGGPANTTYSENTSVLALTKVTDPSIMKRAGYISILLSLFPIVSFIISSIPEALIGGISIILFGMIAGIGIKGIKENDIKMTNKNILIISLILVLGIGIDNISVLGLNMSGLSIGAIVGIFLNKLLKSGGVRDE